jgi:hypothetical protein
MDKDRSADRFPTGSLCRHEFCYECFAPYKGANGVWRLGNSAHQDTCRYAPNSLPTYEGADDMSDSDDNGEEDDDEDDEDEEDGDD